MGEWTGLAAILIGFALIGIGYSVIFSSYAINVVFFVGGLIAIIYGFVYFFNKSSSVTSSKK